MIRNVDVNLNMNATLDLDVDRETSAPGSDGHAPARFPRQLVSDPLRPFGTTEPGRVEVNDQGGVDVQAKVFVDRTLR